MASGIKITGLNAVQRFLLNIVPQTKREIVVITETTIRQMQGEAMRLVAVDTGKARQNITFEILKGGLAAALSCHVPYALFLEFGTGGLVEVPDGFEDLAGPYKGKGKRTINRAAQPFMIPAYLKYRDAYYNAISEAIGRILR